MKAKLNDVVQDTLRLNKRQDGSCYLGYMTNQKLKAIMFFLLPLSNKMNMDHK